MQSWHASARPVRRRSDSPNAQKSPAEDDRAAKLAAMQTAASELDQDREKRLAAVDEKEKAAAQREEDVRMQTAKYGGRADFLNGMNRTAGDMTLGDRIGRGKAYMERTEQEA